MVAITEVQLLANLIWVFGEMDIIFVFETKVVGSIPARPAMIARCSSMDRTILS